MPAANTASVAEPAKTVATKPVLAKPQGSVDPIETASVDGKDPVKVYIDKGKKLPSYISDADTRLDHAGQDRARHHRCRKAGRGRERLAHDRDPAGAAAAQCASQVDQHGRRSGRRKAADPR